MKVDIKKYEYEVEMMHGNQHNKINEFITNLHSSGISNPQAAKVVSSE